MLPAVTMSGERGVPSSRWLSRKSRSLVMTMGLLHELVTVRLCRLGGGVGHDRLVLERVNRPSAVCRRRWW